MTVMVAPPAMPVMVRVSNSNHNLRSCCRNERHQERQGEDSKCKLLHAHGKRPLSLSSNRLATTANLL
jgi:hypothetical protein